jgi:hypothetical protein
MVIIKVSSLITLLLNLIIPLGGNGSVSRRTFNSAFDQYGALCWEDEKARLDSFAIQLRVDPTVIGDIIVYDGKRACRGEAVARALRAKKYLVERRGVEARRVIWRWGGYYDVTWTTLSITPYGAAPWKLSPSVTPGEVKFVGNCQGRVRPVKCRKA